LRASGWHGTGDSFVTTLTKGVDRENHVVDFDEGPPHRVEAL
jgi:hypothetical protein